MKPKKQLRAGIYARVSTQEQVKENYDSIDSQIDSCKANAAKTGDQIVGIFTDPGFSGTNTERPGYQALCKAIKNGEFEKVYVFKIERLHRNIEDGSSFLSTIKRYDVMLQSATESIDLTTPGGKLNVMMLMAFNEYYSNDVKHKQAIKHHNARERGYFVGGTPPLGYERDKDVITPIVEEAKIIKQIFNWHAENIKPIDIMKRLRAAGVKTRRSNHFSCHSVTQILENPIYCGYIKGNPNEDDERPLIKGAHKGIISREKWVATQERLSDARSTKTKLKKKSGNTFYNTNKHEGLLKGLLHCGTTKYALSPARQGKSLYYSLSRASKEGACFEGPIKRVNLSHIDNAVVGLVNELGKYPEIIKATIEAANRSKSPKLQELAEQRTQLMKKHKRLQTEFDNFKSFIANAKDTNVFGEITNDMQFTAERKQYIQNELLQLEREATTIKKTVHDSKEIVAALLNFKGLLEALPFDKRHELIKMLIKRIDIYPSDVPATVETKLQEVKLRTKTYKLDIRLSIRPETTRTCGVSSTSSCISHFGRGDRIRTCDPLVPNQVR